MLTRSTVGKDVPDPDEEALGDLVHWIWSWKVQVKRLIQSTKEQGSGSTPLEQRQSYSLASYDEHLLAVAGGNLGRAIALASKRFPEIAMPQSASEAVRLLRNLYEHWDEQRKAFQNAEVEKKQSAKRFAELYPGNRPWSVVYTTNDWLLGGTVPVQKLTEELEPLEAEVLRLEEERKSRGRGT